MVTRAFLLSVIALVASSCSTLIDVDEEQCKTDNDCAALGDAFKGSVCQQNLCVQPSDSSGGEGGGPSETDPLACTPVELSSEPLVKFSFAPIYAAGAEPAEPKPFIIKACDQLDLECDKPVFGPLEVNAGEPRDFMVKPGFAGYFDIKNPDTIDGLLFLGRPVREDTAGWALTMPTPQLVAGLGLATGEVLDPEKGFILAVARDCAGTLLPGVTVQNSKGGLGYYFLMNLPDTTLTETKVQGAAGFANVPINTTVLTGVHNASGHTLGPVSVRVKAGTLSFAELWP
jgi:hypothetical protein